MFRWPKKSMKSKYNPFSGYKRRYKVCLVYLEWKLQQDSYGWCIFKLKSQKGVERRCLKRSKQQTADDTKRYIH